jgi:hypothetical protein
MKYMMLIYIGEAAMSECEREDCYVNSAQLAQELHANAGSATFPLSPRPARS